MMMGNWSLDNSPGFIAMEYFSHHFSPYDFQSARL